jgi:hypothetical protein
MFGIRNTLKLGSIVFGFSAILLICIPGFFLELLGLNGGSAELVWSMRLIGITLVALAGNMWLNSGSPSDAVVRKAGVVMAISATGLGVVTLLIPVSLTWFAYLYAAVGFAFGLNYFVCLLRKNYG